MRVSPPAIKPAMTRQAPARKSLATTSAPLSGDFYGVSVDYMLGRTACRIKLEDDQKSIIAGYTADELLADVMTLDQKGRQSVRDYIELQLKANRKY